MLDQNNAINLNGVLLLNLGTPDNCTPSGVRRYLREFLSDPRVIDLPMPLRYFLLYGLILPFRPKRSAAAYKAIWTKAGSPLLTHSLDLRNNLQQVMGKNYMVELGMRYGRPSIQAAINKLLAAKVAHINIVPLFPQYSSAATGSAIEKATNILCKEQAIPSFNVIANFYQHPEFIRAWRHIIKQEFSSYEHLLFSYHGLPERQLDKLKLTSCCERKTPCPPINNSNKNCYRAQCYTTTRLIATACNLTNNYSTAFQSRLGRIPWIKPYTDEVLPKLRSQGITKLAVVCPAFTADCLETLEEIGLQAKKLWYNLGGTDFKLIPCLNSTSIWVNALNNIIQGQEQCQQISSRQLTAAMI